MEDEPTTLDAFVAWRSNAASLRATREWERRTWWREFRGHLREGSRAVAMVGRAAADSMRGAPAAWVIGVGYLALCAGIGLGRAAGLRSSGGDD